MMIALIIISIYLVYYDIRYKKVPNIINLLLLVLIIIGKLYNQQPLLPALFSGIAAFVVFILIYTVSKGGIGMGDCKYTAIIAFQFGYYFWLQSIVICSIAALSISVPLLILKKIDKKTRIPFIPFLTFGWFIQYFIESIH